MSERRDTVALLIRHAHTDAIGRFLTGRSAGVPLSAIGRVQADRLGRALAASQLAAIYSSPLERARETAQAIARHQPAPIHVAADLNEVEFGEWTGRSFEELAGDPAWQAFNARRATAAVPGGESAPAVQARAVAAIASLVARHYGQVFAAVSHADVIRAAVLHYAGSSLDRYDRFEIGPASVTAVAFDAARCRLVYVNNTSYASSP